MLEQRLQLMQTKLLEIQLKLIALLQYNYKPLT